MGDNKILEDLASLLKIFIYLSIFVEIFEFALTPDMLPFESYMAVIQEKLESLLIYQYDNLKYSKLFTLGIVLLTIIGTKAKKDIEFDAKKMVLLPLVLGSIMLLASIFMYYNTIQTMVWLFTANILIYIILSVFGVVLIHMAMDNISKHIKDGIQNDPFNLENESFEQCRYLEDDKKYSVNIPMRFYYKGRFNKGWINIINPFRGTFVIGTPGSGKSFSVIEPFIRQHSAKGFCMMVYDYKFPTLAQKLYYHYRINKKKGNVPEGCQFNIINFVDVEYSKRVNPIQHKYIPDLSAAQETANTLVQSLQKGKADSGGGSDNFFQTSAVNFLAACIFFFINHDRLPYDKNKKQLRPEYEEVRPGHKRLTGVVRDDFGNEVEPAYWLGRYSDMPHVLSFLNLDYNTIFEILQTDPEVAPLLGPFQTAMKNKAMEQLEGMIGTLRVQTSRLVTKESYWIFHKDGDEFDLKISDRKSPSYLVIANDPEKEDIIGALNAMILNRLVMRVNSRGNIPVSIIVDELPTLYFHKIDNLIATARSNKVAVVLGFQELPQLEANYGKVNMEKIVATIGNVLCGSLRNKETLEWVATDIMGRAVQIHKNMSVDQDKTSITYNEGLDNLVQASKIADLATGWLVGQVARDFIATKTGIGGSMNIQKSKEFETSKFFCKTNFDMKEIAAEEDDYKNYAIPKFVDFGSKAQKERMLYHNFERVTQEVIEMANRIVSENKK